MDNKKIINYLTFITQKRHYTSNEIKGRITKKFWIKEESIINELIVLLEKKWLLNDNLFIKINTESYLHSWYWENYIKRFFQKRLINIKDVIIDKKLEKEYLIDYIAKTKDSIKYREEYDKFFKKLQWRWYNISIITEVMNIKDFNIIWNKKGEEWKIRSKLYWLLKKWYSKKYIIQKTNQDYWEWYNVDDYITEKEFEEYLKEYIKKNKLTNDKKSISKLLSKWHNFNTIKNLLS